MNTDLSTLNFFLVAQGESNLIIERPGVVDFPVSISFNEEAPEALLKQALGGFALIRSVESITPINEKGIPLTVDIPYDGQRIIGLVGAKFYRIDGDIQPFGNGARWWNIHFPDNRFGPGILAIKEKRI